MIASLPLSAQWMKYPTAGMPRTKDGKPDMKAAAPKTKDGHPDFSGLWSAPNYSTRYLENIAVDGVDVPFQPWAAALYK